MRAVVLTAAEFVAELPQRLAVTRAAEAQPRRLADLAAVALPVADSVVADTWAVAAATAEADTGKLRS
jgi:hypothetical protein